MCVRRQRGFTLVELIVVVAIFAMLVAIALSNIRSSLPHYRLLNASRRLAASIHMARTRAILTSLEHRLTQPGAGGVGWQVEEGDQPFGSGAWTQGGEVVDLTDDYYGVSLQWPGDIVCAPNGAVTSPGPVILGNANATEQMSVTVTPWGEVTVAHL